MGTGHKFGEPVEDGSGLRLVRRWRLLLAHDASASTCNALIDAIEGALGHVDVNESSSIDDARVAMDAGRFDLCMVCLDLPPAPQGGARLALEVLRQGVPLVLITRSLRWIPPSAGALREVPWVPPDATVAEVSRAIADAMATLASAAPAPPASRRAGLEARASGSE